MNKGKYLIYLSIFFTLTAIFLIFWQSHWLNKEALKKTPKAGDILIPMHNCFQARDSTSCYREISGEFLSKFSLKDILSIIEQNQNQPELFQSCHEMGHFLGREQIRKVKDVQEAMSECIPICFAGCYHGVLEGYLIDKNLSFDVNNPELIKAIKDLCNSPDKQTSTEVFNQCLHGLGHALMFLTQSDLPKALTLCDNLDSTSVRDWCYSGAFMENSTSSTNKDHPSKYLKKEDPMYPCTILEDRYLNMCYALQSFYFAEVSGYDWQKTIDLCSRVPQSYQETCFRSIGQNLVGFTQDLDLIKTNCNLIGPTELKQACIQGVEIALSSKYAGDLSKNIQFCSLLDTKYKKSCYLQLGISARNWSSNTEEINKACAAIAEDQYRYDCTNP